MGMKLDDVDLSNYGGSSAHAQRLAEHAGKALATARKLSSSAHTLSVIIGARLNARRIRFPAAPVTGWLPALKRAAVRAVRNAAWRVNRLRCMSGAEIGHRTLRALTHRAERLGWFAPAGSIPVELAPPCRPWIHREAG